VSGGSFAGVTTDWGPPDTFYLQQYEYYWADNFEKKLFLFSYLAIIINSNIDNNMRCLWFQTPPASFKVDEKIFLAPRSLKSASLYTIENMAQNFAHGIMDALR
jgi:hypothetical protein